MGPAVELIRPENHEAVKDFERMVYGVNHDNEMTTAGGGADEDEDVLVTQANVAPNKICPISAKLVGLRL
jgi:hypothetical protein